MTWWKSLMALGLLCVIVGQANASTIVVVPNFDAGFEGNSDLGPFNISAFSYPSQRYQQIYSASAFGAVNGPLAITQIAFRPDSVHGSAFSATLANVQIDLSTTSHGPDGLSSTFANNVGADVTTVHSGLLTLSSSFSGPVSGPKDFDIIIHLATPFTFDPAHGNLLLDIRNFSGGLTTQFDAQNSNGDAVSRYMTFPPRDVNSAVANYGDTIGLVTQFTFEPVTITPEPATMTLLGFGVAAMTGYRMWLRGRKRSIAT